MKKQFAKSFASWTAALLLTLFAAAVPAFAQEAEEPRTLVTEYGGLWTDEIAVQVGVPVRWIVEVPEGEEPVGCGATVKIPGLGWGTDSHNKEEGHLTLEEGENLVYEFTPEETGDILFTCWMGSGCHHNYIHVTEDGTYVPPETQQDGDLTAASADAELSPATGEISPTALAVLAASSLGLAATAKRKMKGHA